MKLKATIVAMMVASASIMAQPEGEEKHKTQQNQEIAELEMDLLREYIEEDSDIQPVKVVFYNSDFEFVKQAEIDFYEEHDEEIEHLILHSVLLMDDGTERIYQLKK